MIMDKITKKTIKSIIKEFKKETWPSLSEKEIAKKYRLSEKQAYEIKDEYIWKLLKKAARN